MYVRGQGGEKNYPEANRLYDKAIELGNSASMNNRAWMYEKGLGGKKNYLEAIRLYEAASRLGNLTAIGRRADMQKIFHKQFNKAIHVLQEKMADFQSDPKLQEAHKAASKLYSDLEKQGKDFFKGKPSREDYELFKSNCEEHIKDARKVLDQHRGWKKIVLNIFAMIVTAGIGYAIAAGINIAIKGRFTFFSTDSSEKLSELEEHIENKANKAAPAA